MAILIALATASYELTDFTKVGGLSDINTVNLDDAAAGYYTGNNDHVDALMLWDTTNLSGDAVSINSLYQGGKFGRSASGAGNFVFIHNIAGVTYNSVGVVNVPYPANWNEKLSATFDPGSGGSWTPSLYNGARFGIRGQGDGAAYGNVTSLKVVIDYVASGMFTVTYALPFIGIIGIGQLMQRLMPRIKYDRLELERIGMDFRNSQRSYNV